jgi:hypothetical protein
MKFKLQPSWRLLSISFFLFITGCQKESPSFLFWCVRPELVTKEINISAVDNAVKQSVDESFKKMDGFVSSQWNSNKDSLMLTYKTSEARYMNFERVLMLHQIVIQPQIK